jgi:replication-associated recombination protein RarA
MLDTAKYDPHSPKTISDIVGNTEIWKTFYDLIQSNKASHTILVGNAGCGKSLFLRLALSGFPTLIIDCTANFGLRDVRESIRTFARCGLSADGRLRWVVFKHADSLTADTQAFLRRMLETTSSFTRFVFECRDVGAITEPIVSRCAIIHIHNPDKTEATYELMRRTEHKLGAEIVHGIVEQSQGNMRNALVEALARWHTADEDIHIGHGGDSIHSLLECRPKTSDPAEWMKWAIQTEETARTLGIDLRDILKLGWPLHPSVSYHNTLLCRLGGASPRTLFMSALVSLVPIVF